MQTRKATLGGLKCRIVGSFAAESTPPAVSSPSTIASTTERSTPSLAVILCHGYGAPGDDLVPLANEIHAIDPLLASRIVFLFPEAPLRLTGLSPFDSRAWWPLDARALEAAMIGGSPLDVRRVAPPELPAVRRSLECLVDEARRMTSLPLSRVVLGGFSQGAMLATDLAFHLADSPAGLCIFSGTLLDEEEWRRLAPARKGMPVILSHGRQDPLLSFTAATALRSLLVDAGLEVAFLPFDGPHTIAAEGFSAMVDLLRKLVARSD